MKIKLDTKTPRAAPGNSLALFYDQYRKKDMTQLLEAYIISAYTKTKAITEKNYETIGKKIS